jgi:hypothetical protein
MTTGIPSHNAPASLPTKSDNCQNPSTTIPQHITIHQVIICREPASSFSEPRLSAGGRGRFRLEGFYAD